MTEWFEDIPLDQAWDLGTHTFTAEEITTFAHDYDPQYLHVDPEVAAAGPYGSIIASGWHTVSIGQRKLIDFLDAEAIRIRAEGRQPGETGPSPGVTKMQFKAPVRPGDTVRFTLTVTGKRRSGSIPGWGITFNRIEAVNQTGAPVYVIDITGLSKLRDA